MKAEPKQIFRPDTRTRWLSADASSETTVFAESISQTGKCIVVTAHTRNDQSIAYGLTHKLTGASLTGSRLSVDLISLKRLARRFWRCLEASDKKLWSTCSDPQQIIENTPVHAINELKRYRPGR